MTITAYALYTGDVFTDCMIVEVVGSRECAEAWLDENAPFDGGYEKVDVEGPGVLCHQCGRVHTDDATP